MSDALEARRPPGLLSRERRGRLVTIVGISLAVAGIALVVIAMASQNHAPQPSALAAGSPGASLPGSGTGRSSLGVGPLSRSKPVSIDIPVIGVHSSMLSLGLNADGTNEVPSGASFDEAGWYKYSPTPGSIGPSVILGHVDSGNYGASVFFKLGKLEPGDRVMVTRRDGIVAVFEITGLREVPKTAFPTKLVYGNQDSAKIRLITCGGRFDSSTGHYVDNIIAFGTLIGSHDAAAPAQPA